MHCAQGFVFVKSSVTGRIRPAPLHARFEDQYAQDQRRTHPKDAVFVTYDGVQTNSTIPDLEGMLALEPQPP